MQQSSSKRWPLRPLGEVVKTIKGRKPARTVAVAKSCSLPYATADYFRCGAASSYVVETALDSVVLCRDGAPTLIWDGSNAGEVFIGKRAVLASTMARIDVNEEVLTPIFCYFFLKTAFDALNGRTTGSTIPHVSRSTLESLQIPTPPKPEQEKIAAVLWKVQRAIATQDRLIAATHDLKASAMQRLFTRGLHNEPLKDTEIGPMPESWQPTTIGGIAKLSAGGTPSRGMREYWQGGTIPWVKTGEVNYDVILDTQEKITPLGLANSAANLLPEGTLLVAMYGQGVTRGKVAILGIEAATNQACAAIRSDDEKVCTDFLFHSLTHGYERLRGLAHGGQQQNLNADLIRGFTFACSQDINEQRAIATMLAAIDHKLTYHQKKRAALNDLFQTLLHKLMTAEIRVNRLDIDTTDVSLP